MKRIDAERRLLRKFLVISFLSLTILTTPSCFERYNIHEVKTLELLEKEVAKLDKDCLVVFDVDWTLFVGADCINRPKAVRKNYFEEFTKDLSKEEYENFFSCKIIQLNFMLVSEKTPGLIKKLQGKGVKVVALTAVRPGRYGVIEKLEDKRFQELKDFDIDFSSAFPEIKEIEFKELEEVSSGIFPLFKKGILFGMQKGKLLGAFLDQTGFKPRRIIFVDDRVKHVKEVAQMAKEKNIEFLGLHYTEVKSLSCEDNDAMQTLQANTFVKTGKWLSDEQAKKQLESKGK